MSASRVALFDSYVRNPFASSRSRSFQAKSSPLAARMEDHCETVVSSFVVAIEILPRSRGDASSSNERGHDAASGRTRRLIIAVRGHAVKDSHV